MKLNEAGRLFDEALRKAPRNLTLLIYKADVLALANRWQDVETILGSLLFQTDLSSGTRAVLLACQIKAFLRQENQERARSMVESFLNHQPSLLEKLYLLDQLSCVPFMDGLRGCLPDAETWSEQALRLQPESLTLKGTRGAILVEQGKNSEGEVLLKEVYDKSEADVDKGVASLFLALCAKRRGDLECANRLAKRARLIHLVPWLLKRLESEFGKAP